MPREGTKTRLHRLFIIVCIIEIKYAPGGDENPEKDSYIEMGGKIEIKYAPGGDENPHICGHSKGD